MNPHLSISLSGLALVSFAALTYGLNEHERSVSLRKENASVEAQAALCRESSQRLMAANGALQNQLADANATIQQMRNAGKVQDDTLSRLPSADFRRTPRWGDR
jgi:hypothetical protein